MIHAYRYLANRKNSNQILYKHRSKYFYFWNILKEHNKYHKVPNDLASWVSLYIFMHMIFIEIITTFNWIRLNCFIKGILSKFWNVISPLSIVNRKNSNQILCEIVVLYIGRRILLAVGEIQITDSFISAKCNNAFVFYYYLICRCNYRYSHEKVYPNSICVYKR